MVLEKRGLRRTELIVPWIKSTRVMTTTCTRLSFDKVLNLLQLSTLMYYLHETNPDNGLVRDKTDPKAPVSIAAVGIALATTPVVLERAAHHPGVRGQDYPEAAPIPP